jgi:hypothetical protein
MRPSLLLPALLSTTLAATVGPSTKRGLIYVPNPSYPSDDSIWLSPNTSLTWYYNYQASPSPHLSSRPDLHFVPMLWGAPASPTDTTFLTTITTLLKSGTNITHILSFNEPDSSSAGGSALTPALAASTWIRLLEPLRPLGVKLVAPAVTGAPTGLAWLAAFFDACNGGCTADVMPIHWYGDFDGLASHMAEKRARYPNMTTWVTEYALAQAPLGATQEFFNVTAEYFDRLGYVERYSYFGAFRSSESNVGPNAAMLTEKGELTDIGSLYLGGAETGRVPGVGAGKKGGAGRGAGIGGWAVLVVGAVGVMLW